MTQPIRADERDLMRRVLAHPRGWLREDDDSLVETTKREEYVLAKWERRRWWESGVSSRAGWITDAGREHFKGVLAEDEDR